MTDPTAGNIIAICALTMSLFSSIYIGVFKFGQMAVKVDTIWSLLFRQGVTDILRSQLGSHNSPLVIFLEAQSWLDPIAEALKAFGVQHRKLTDAAFYQALERSFGGQITRLICEPHHVSQLGALHIAATVARDKAIHIEDS